MKNGKRNEMRKAIPTTGRWKWFNRVLDSVCCVYVIPCFVGSWDCPPAMELVLPPLCVCLERRKIERMGWNGMELEEGYSPLEGVSKKTTKHQAQRKMQHCSTGNEGSFWRQ
jgi:hypothetical protein